jgi:DnaJ-class molecular chaperone
MTIPLEPHCKRCDGDGVVSCRECHGEELFRDAWDHRSESHYTAAADCIECNGQLVEMCRECEGTGVDLSEDD